MAAIRGFAKLDERDSSPSVNKKGSEPTRQTVKFLDPNVKIAFGWSRFTLRIVGLWPDQTCRKFQSNPMTRYMSLLIAIWVIVFVTIPLILASIIYTCVLDEIIELIIDVAGFVGATARIIVFWYNGEAWCISIVTEDWTQKRTVKEQELMIKNARISRGISIGVTILASSALGACFFVKSVPLFYMNFDNPNDTDFGKQLMAPSYFPFDLKKPSNFAFAYSGQVFGFAGATIAYASADCFVATIIIHLCGQITILRYALIELIDENTSVSSVIFRAKLAIIVKRHNTLTKLATVINDAINVMLLVVILVYTIEFGLQLFRLLLAVTEREPGKFPLAKVIFGISLNILMLVHLLGYCYIGDMLINESEALGLATYSCKWYDLSDRRAKDLILVMHRARTPCQLCAGKFVPFSLELFGNVLKTSMGYFSLLLTMKERSAH